MILTDWSLPWMEYFIARDTQRTIIPLWRHNSCADSYVQWKRPPHPEWINEDCKNRDNAGSVRYRRMYENGAQDVYPYTVLTSPEVIDTALASGRSVYLITTGGNTLGDYGATIGLIYRYNVDIIEGGWRPGREMSKEVKDLIRKFAIARVTAKPKRGIHVWTTPDGHVSFRGETGFIYTLRAHLESVSEDRTQLKILCEGVKDHSEMILHFKEGLDLQTMP